MTSPSTRCRGDTTRTVTSAPASLRLQSAAPSHRGRPAIEAAYAEFFKLHPNEKIDVAVDAVRMLGDSAAIEEGHASLVGGKGGAAKYTALHVKDGGKWKMALVREAILRNLRVHGPMTFAQLGMLVESDLQGSFSGSVIWYFTAVKLDMESRGEIRRIPNSRPQMIEVS